MCSFVSQSLLENGDWNYPIKLPVAKSVDLGFFWQAPIDLILPIYFFSSLNPICRPVLEHHLSVHFVSVLVDLVFCRSI